MHYFEQNFRIQNISLIFPWLPVCELLLAYVGQESVACLRRIIEIFLSHFLELLNIYKLKCYWKVSFD